MSPDILLRPEEVAERLGLSRLTAVRWMRSGKLKGQKIGRKSVRMKAKDLEVFIESQPPTLTLVPATEPRSEADGNAATPQPELPALDRRIRERLAMLQQPGETIGDVLHRAVLALETQAMPGRAPRAEDALSYGERKAAIVARLRDMKAQGLTLQAMADQLMAEGVPTLSHKGTWKKGTVSNLLKE